MPPAKPTKRAATTAPGVKVFITAASLAATVGGWALIGAQNNTVEPPPITPTAEAKPEPVVLSINLQPLPTIVPPPTLQPQLVTASNRSTVPSQPAPKPTAQALPVLRVVTAPGGGGGGGGAPAATTHSSR